MSWREGRQRHEALVAVAILLASCGGSDGDAQLGSVAVVPGQVPTPAPLPSPTPSPTSSPLAIFEPVIARIFADPLRSPVLFVAGKGWQFDYVVNSQSSISNSRDADDYSVTYDAPSSAYRLSLPLLGSGILYQTSAPRVDDERAGQTFFAALASDVNAARGQTPVLVLKSGSPTDRYAYVSWAAWSSDAPLGGSLQTTSYGVAGFAQPTAADDISVIGQATFRGEMLGYMEKNAGDFLSGKAEFQIDRGTGAVTGTVSFTLNCYMGCSYPATTYRLANIAYTRGGTSFTGDLIADGAPSIGRISGTFAGPGGQEVLARYEAPYFDRDSSRWTKSGGVVVGKSSP